MTFGRVGTTYWRGWRFLDDVCTSILYNTLLDIAPADLPTWKKRERQFRASEQFFASLTSRKYFPISISFDIPETFVFNKCCISIIVLNDIWVALTRGNKGLQNTVVLPNYIFLLYKVNTYFVVVPLSIFFLFTTLLLRSSVLVTFAYSSDSTFPVTSITGCWTKGRSLRSQNGAWAEMAPAVLILRRFIVILFNTFFFSFFKEFLFNPYLSLNLK